MTSPHNNDPPPTYQAPVTPFVPTPRVLPDCELRAQGGEVAVVDDGELTKTPGGTDSAVVDGETSTDGGLEVTPPEVLSPLEKFFRDEETAIESIVVAEGTPEPAQLYAAVFVSQRTFMKEYVERIGGIVDDSSIRFVITAGQRPLSVIRIALERMGVFVRSDRAGPKPVTRIT